MKARELTGSHYIEVLQAPEVDNPNPGAAKEMDKATVAIWRKGKLVGRFYLSTRLRQAALSW